MSKRTVSGIMLTLLLSGMLTLAFNIKPVTFKPRTIIVRDEYSTTQQIKNTLDQTELEPTYVGVARYYDNRKCAVVSTHDDLSYNASWWENCLFMLTEKKIYHTVAIITNGCRGEGWDFIQYWLDQGYTEAGSHSRNHVHAPYTGNDPYNGKPRVSYEWQINGSKNDITGNLTLPNWWRHGDREYVYAWIEPFGSYDGTVRQWLGDTYYLSDRNVNSGVYSFAGWDSNNELFKRIGYTVEMGSPPWGGGDTLVSSLNSKFDSAYNNGKIYHLITHPRYVNWNESSYADQHTDYLSNRKDVWYVPFGLLYLYHWVDVRNITNVTSVESGQNKIFKVSINETTHLNYGVSYPITYVFDVPSGWTSGYVYYRYLDTAPWTLMDNKSSEEFFNGIAASRFNLTEHKAYVSIGFSSVSHDIYLQLRNSKRIEVPNGYPTIQEAINHANEGDTIYVKAGTYHENVVVNKTVSIIGENKETAIIESNATAETVTVTANNTNLSGFTIQNPRKVAIRLENVSNTTIKNLNLNDNFQGIVLISTRNSRVFNCNITNNDYGIRLNRSSNNIFYHNEFIDNIKQIYLYESFGNEWDDGYPSGGNYWCDCTSEDLYRGPYQNETGSDGIGDTPYIIDENNADRYPLMHTWPTPTPPIVTVFPETIELGPENATGQEFNIAVVVENVTYLWGFDIRLSWNTTYLTYVNHTYTFPVEDFPDSIPPSPYPGILYKDLGSIMPMPGHGVKPELGQIVAAVICLPPEPPDPPMPPFNGSGTVFMLRLKVKYHPSEVDTEVPLHLFSTDLAAKSPPAPSPIIPHERQDGKVIIHALAVHDLTVAYVTTSKSVVGQNYTLSINATITNQGELTETFNVTAYADTTIIATLTNIILTSGNSTTVIFTWNTTGVAKGNYTITAYAWPVPGETDISDNTFTDGWVVVTIPGDVDGDFDVDIYDVVLITSIYGSKQGDTLYNPNMDLWWDGVINIYDVVICTSNYGQMWQP